MEQRLMWSDRCGNNETVRDGAKRFVAEFFGVERDIRWGNSPGEFWFSDGAWLYRIECEAGVWKVWRTTSQTKKAKAYSKARRIQRPRAD